MFKKITLILFSITLLVLPSAILAFLPAPATPIGGFSSIWTFFVAILENIIWLIFIAVAIIMFIYAGFLFVTASGEPAKLNTAKLALLGGFIGVAIAMLAISLPSIIYTSITNPAPPTPIVPVAPTGACCLGPICTLVQQSICIQVWNGAPSCSPNPCR